MTNLNTPNSRCRAAIARCDITPPIGIYHRMWGAALHDQATAVHRPLEATLLWLEPAFAKTASQAQILISLDHCILDSSEIHTIRQSIHAATTVAYENILVTLTHTHGSGWMSRSRSHLPGGEMIGPYLDRLAQLLVELACQAQSQVQPSTIVYGTGHCNLAAHRDFFDPDLGQFVCGFNPLGQADDSLQLARITDLAGKSLATVVNYACHPTTLAWDNTMISPDWVGAMRQVIEQAEGGLCIFLQGASGDLGPREGFVGDTAVADRNGRQVGFAALSTLATLPPPGTSFRYTGPVTSGTRIGTWQHQPLPKNVCDHQETWHWEELVVELPYRHDLPTIEQTTSERAQWLAEEANARSANDEIRIRDCRAQVEQSTRQLTRLEALVPGQVYPLKMHLGILGDAIWLFVPGELYQIFQTTLRTRFAPRPVIVCTLTNDWQPGYIPPASTFGYGIYQDIIAATSPGCLEIMIEVISRRLNQLNL